MISSRILKTLITRSFGQVFENSNVRTAGIIIIGDEILKGEVIDTNSTYLVKKLYGFGVRVKKVSVIGDDVKEICEEVQIFSKKYTYVITSGGIGPTHDDVTFEAIAKAFGEPLIPHPILVDLCQKYFNTTDINCPGMKLAYIPKSAKLIFSEIPEIKVKAYPNITIKNVYIFPGIPQLLERLFETLGSKLFLSTEKFFKRVAYFNVTEKSLVSILNGLVKEFPNVVFGSYPVLENKYYKVKITIEATEEEVLIAAHRRMLELMPKEYIVTKHH